MEQAGCCIAIQHVASARGGALGVCSGALGVCSGALGARGAWGPQAGRVAAGGTRSRRGVRGAQSTAGWAAWEHRLGQVGALCTWLSSNSVFDPVLTQYCS